MRSPPGRGWPCPRNSHAGPRKRKSILLMHCMGGTVEIRRSALVLGSLALLGCESDEIVIPVTTGQVIQLTQAQAATLVSRMTSFSSTNSSLAALGDSARFVLTAGAEARQISVTTDI